MTAVDYFVLGTTMTVAMGLLVLLGIASRFHKNRDLQLTLSTVLLLVIIITSIAMLLFGQSYNVLGIFNIYTFSMFFVVLLSVGFLMINIMSFDYSDDYFSFSLLYPFVIIGALSVAMASSFLTILLGIELLTVPTVLMIMMAGSRYIEAALKLFILGSVGIATLAFAITLIFPYVPGLALVPFAPSASILGGGYLTVLALLLMIAALSFDASLFPFNLWIPDVYTGAATNITAMLAGINKKVAFIALFEVLFIVMFRFVGTYSIIFQILAIVTMFFGNITALVQTNVKRLFAYSSISQAGYIAIGIAAGTAYGITASIVQITAHMFMIIGSFAIVLWLESKKMKTIEDYNGLNSRNSLMAISLTIFMLSMIGIPPLLGFTGKFLLFTSAINSNLIWLALIGIINSFISVYYYAKVIFAMYSRREKNVLRSDWTISTVVVFCLIVIILFGIFPQQLLNLASSAGSSLLFQGF